MSVRMLAVQAPCAHRALWEETELPLGWRTLQGPLPQAAGAPSRAALPSSPGCQSGNWLGLDCT